MSDDLSFVSAADLRRRINRKEVSPLEVTKAVPCARRAIAT
jgi:hypothetical protein